MTNFQNIVYEKKGKIACVTNSRSHLLNAIDLPTQNGENKIGAGEFSSGTYSKGAVMASPSRYGNR